MEYILQEDISRQKRASEIIKIASMGDECWACLKDIYNIPKAEIIYFNDRAGELHLSTFSPLK